MTRALASLLAAVAVALATGLAHPARADDPLGAAVLAADPLATVLIGPSGQVWEPDGHGAWIRDTPGGLAADVHGAALADALVVVGKSAPPYRWDGASWQALRLGERGRTIAGTGPRAAIAIGGQIFVWSAPQWKRVGKVTGPVTALWAASDTKVLVGANGKLWRYASKRFVEVSAVAVTGFAGPTPWAITRDGQLYDPAARKPTAIVIAGAAVTPLAIAADPHGALWVLGTSGQQPTLAHKQGATWEALPAPALAADDVPVGFAIGAGGTGLIATRAGAIWLRAADGSWRPGRREDQLAPARPGPGPARVP